jgi:hypothetical protein
MEGATQPIGFWAGRRLVGEIASLARHWQVVADPAK